MIKRKFLFLIGKGVTMQIHFLSTLLFGLSSNADNLVVGMSYGIKKMPIKWKENLIVALITFTGTILSMILGKSLLLFLPQKLAGILGSIIIMSIGVIGLLQFLIKIRKSGEESEEEEELAMQTLTRTEALILGLALTLNNIGLGIGASITGLPVISTALCSFLFSLFFLYIGNLIGRSKLAELVGEFAEPLACLLMIGLGVYELFI